MKVIPLIFTVIIATAVPAELKGNRVTSILRQILNAHTYDPRVRPNVGVGGSLRS